MDNNYIERTGTGQGFDETSALQNWIESDETFINLGVAAASDVIAPNTHVIVQCLRRPKLAKRIKTEKFTQKGSRKFVTGYRVVDPITGSYMSFSNDVEGLVPGLLNAFKTQAFAIEAAKELSKIYHQPYDVYIAKVLVQGQEKIATLVPHDSVPGEYRFTAQFLF